MTFLSPLNFYWLLVLPVVVIIYVIARRKHLLSLTLLNFSASNPVAVHSKRLRLFETLLLIICLSLVAISLTRPSWGTFSQKEKSASRDIIFLLDVSRSMLGEDRHPSRLENAKISILECIEAFPNNRMGLVVFGESASLISPLTFDHNFLRLKLSRINMYSVRNGGTNINSALKFVYDFFFEENREGMQDIILLTDGESHGEKRLSIAKELNQSNTGIIVVGLGDSELGSRIPMNDGNSKSSSFFTHDGEEVWTKLNESHLINITKQVNSGLYLPAGVKAYDLSNFYHQFTEQNQNQAFNSNEQTKTKEQFQHFVLIGLISLLIMIILPKIWIQHSMSIIALVFFIGLGNPLLSEEKKSAIDLYQSFEFEEAYHSFINQSAIIEVDVQKSKLLYYAGNSAYRITQTSPQANEYWFEQAMACFREAYLIYNKNKNAASNLEIAYQAMKDWRKEKEEEKENEDQDRDSGESQESEDGEYEEEEEGEYDESSENSQSMNNSNSQFESKTLSENPVTAKDILQEENLNNQLREAAQKTRYQPGDKDW